MPTNYVVSDGDYIDADYTKLLNDIQAEADFDIGDYLELCVSFEDGEIKVLGSNDEGSEWIWERSFPVPAGWSIELIQSMFMGNVYFQLEQ